MYYYDLAAGHRVLWAGKDLMRGCEHHLQEARIPAEEASRLLMNRCAGLLFARERLDRRPFLAEDGDFVWRNLAKAQLAFGDAVLALRGLYHWSCRERHHRLRRLVDPEGLPWLETLLEHHAGGVSFKLHPRRFAGSKSELTAKYEAVARLALSVWLWVESRRLGRAFESAEEYTDGKTNKLPRSGALRNWVATGLKCGPSHCFSSSCFRHPRERVLHWLTFLLWPPTAEGEGALRDRARAELGAVSRESSGTDSGVYFTLEAMHVDGEPRDRKTGPAGQGSHPRAGSSPIPGGFSPGQSRGPFRRFLG